MNHELNFMIQIVVQNSLRTTNTIVRWQNTQQIYTVYTIHRHVQWCTSLEDITIQFVTVEDTTFIK